MKIMKIGILTFTASDNYGQRLQNYALQEILLKSGNYVRTIKQSEDSITMFRLVKLGIKLLIGKEHNWNKLLRKVKFYLFDKKYIKYSRMVDTWNPTKVLNKKYDKFVSGSDQVWAPIQYRFPMYMQSFADSSKKYSYAASIASYDIDANLKNEYKKYLQDFVCISVREERSKEILEEILDEIEICVDLDPTLLLSRDDWIRVEKKPKWLNEEEYILAYNLDSDISDELRIYAKDKRLNIISLMKDKSKAYISDPAEFVYLIHHASLVYTDSYHGTIFSIIFEKIFVHATRNVVVYNMNSRFDTLFHKLGVNIKDVSSVSASLNANIYDNLYIRLQEEKKKSLRTINLIANHRQ